MIRLILFILFIIFIFTQIIYPILTDKPIFFSLLRFKEKLKFKERINKINKKIINNDIITEIEEKENNLNKK